MVGLSWYFEVLILMVARAWLLVFILFWWLLAEFCFWAFCFSFVFVECSCLMVTLGHEFVR